MPCVIADNATPKTGGKPNRAQPTTTSRFEPGISKSALPKVYPGAPGYNPLAQSPPASLKSQISDSLALYETNPISAYQVSRPTPKMRNEPNLPPSHPTIHYSPLTIHYFTKRTQSQQINHKPLRHKHLGLFGHKSLPGKHLGGSATQDCADYTEALIMIPTT